MKDYEICIEHIEPDRSSSSLLGRFLWSVVDIIPDTTKTAQCTVIRTEKNEEEIREYYKKEGYLVTGISECTRTKNQELEII